MIHWHKIPQLQYKAFTKYLATSSTWGLSDATLEYIRYHIMSNTSSSNNDVNVTIRVKDKTSGDGIMFTIKKITKMKKVFKVYAQVKGIEESSLCFMLDARWGACRRWWYTRVIRAWRWWSNRLLLVVATICLNANTRTWLRLVYILVICGV